MTGEAGLPEGWWSAPGGYYYRFTGTGRPRQEWFVSHDAWNKCWRVTNIHPHKRVRGLKAEALVGGVGFADPITAMIAANVELAMGQ